MAASRVHVERRSTRTRIEKRRASRQEPASRAQAELRAVCRCRERRQPRCRLRPGRWRRPEAAARDRPAAPGRRNRTAQGERWREGCTTSDSSRRTPAIETWNARVRPVGGRSGQRSADVGASGADGLRGADGSWGRDAPCACSGGVLAGSAGAVTPLPLRRLLPHAPADSRRPGRPLRTHCPDRDVEGRDPLVTPTQQQQIRARSQR